MIQNPVCSPQGQPPDLVSGLVFAAAAYAPEALLELERPWPCHPGVSQQRMPVSWRGPAGPQLFQPAAPEKKDKHRILPPRKHDTDKHCRWHQLPTLATVPEICVWSTHVELGDSAKTRELVPPGSWASHCKAAWLASQDIHTHTQSETIEQVRGANFACVLFTCYT